MSKTAVAWGRVRTEKSYLEISEWERTTILRLTHSEKFSKIRALINNLEAFNNVFETSYKPRINKI